MGLPFLWPMDIDPSGPYDQAHRALFLSSSIINLESSIYIYMWVCVCVAFCHIICPHVSRSATMSCIYISWCCIQHIRNWENLTFKCPWASLTVFPSFFFFQLWPSFRKFLSILRSNNTIVPPVTLRRQNRQHNNLSSNWCCIGLDKRNSVKHMQIYQTKAKWCFFAFN